VVHTSVLAPRSGTHAWPMRSRPAAIEADRANLRRGGMYATVRWTYVALVVGALLAAVGLGSGPAHVGAALLIVGHRLARTAVRRRRHRSRTTTLGR
jgi:uncharacterized membrane protein